MNMQITVAKHSGFCMGVKNAVLKIINEINTTDHKLYMYGPLIHNPQTIGLLQDRGLTTIHSLENISKKHVAIRTHGVPLEEIRLIKKCAEKVINLTCSRVAKVQALIKKYSAMGYYTIIAGDKDHAEVVGLKSYAAAGVMVVSSSSEISGLPQAAHHLVVSQTTFDRKTFNDIVDAIQKKRPDITVFDTICDSTRLRQDDVIEGIQKGNDTLIVVGGKNSANTKRLAKIGTDHNIKTLHIETEEELAEEDFLDSSAVLVTAGTSTPGWIINNVLEKLYTIKFKKRNIVIKSALLLMEFIVRTNLLSAVAALFISRITMAYAGLGNDLIPPVISSLYIFSMYSINNYFERKFLKLSNPHKYVIYEKYGLPLLCASIILILLSLYLASGYNNIAVIILGVSYLLGLSYSTMPMKSFIEKIKPGFLKKVYYSKVVSCLGWIMGTVLLPMLVTRIDFIFLTSLCALTFTVIFLRMMLLDQLAFQGDLIMGRVTLPLWLGVRGISILAYVVSAAGILVFGLITVSMNSWHFTVFILNILYYLVLMNIITRLNYIISLKYEQLIDLNFILMILFYFLIK